MPLKGFVQDLVMILSPTLIMRDGGTTQTFHGDKEMSQIQGITNHNPFKTIK
jgi:hypothetical protein